MKNFKNARSIDLIFSDKLVKSPRLRGAKDTRRNLKFFNERYQCLHFVYVRSIVYKEYVSEMGEWRCSFFPNRRQQAQLDLFLVVFPTIDVSDFVEFYLAFLI